VTVILDNSQTAEKTVFLLDTETGKIWKFQPSYIIVGAGGTAIPEMFVPIPFNDATGSHSTPQ
jgi:hypothetical protein